MSATTESVRAVAYNAGLANRGQAWELVQLDLAEALGCRWEALPVELQREARQWWEAGRRAACGNDPSRQPIRRTATSTIEAWMARQEAGE